MVDTTYECTRCEATWMIKKKPGTAKQPESCPVCTLRDVNELKHQLMEMEDKIKAYKLVLEDLGIYKMPVQTGLVKQPMNYGLDGTELDTTTPLNKME